MRSIALSVVRNCRDIIVLSTLHHVLFGVDRCIVIDNGSTDGTLEILQAIATKLPNVEVRSDPSDFRQAKMTNAVINEYTPHEKSLVIPFDADEFWNGSVDTVIGYLGRRGVNTLSCRVIRFVQSQGIATPTRFSWSRAYRRVKLTGSSQISEPQRLVRERQRSFVELEPHRKVLFCAEGEVELTLGAHDVMFPGKKVVECDAFVCLHLPLRAKTELIKRAFDYEPRRQPYRRSPNQSWQSAHFRKIVLANETESEWRANSYGAFGKIDVFGRQRSTKVDFRLLRRMCRAYAYGKYLGLPL